MRRSFIHETPFDVPPDKHKGSINITLYKTCKIEKRLIIKNSNNVILFIGLCFTKIQYTAVKWKLLAQALKYN